MTVYFVVSHDSVILLQVKTWQRSYQGQTEQKLVCESTFDCHPVGKMPVKGQKHPSVSTSQFQVNWLSSEMRIYCSHLKVSINYFPIVQPGCFER